MRRQSVIIILLVSSLILSNLIINVVALSDQWVVIARFCGSESTQTELITCDYQWRIRVEVVPNIITHYFFGDLLNFSVIILPHENEADYYQLISMENGDWTDTKEIGTWTDFNNGTSAWSNNYEELSIQNYVEKFYLNIKAELVDYYLVIIEQNTNSTKISKGNWFEVIRFSEKDNKSTYFSCDSLEWRIKWNFNSSHKAFHFPDLYRFSISTIKLDIWQEDYNTQEIENIEVINIIEPTRFSNRGIETINDQVGNFYLLIETSHAIEDYTIVIEQNIDSIPEFSSWIILPILLVSTLVLMVLRNRLEKKGIK